MTTWLYHHPGIEVPQRGPTRWHTERWNELSETLGPTQLALMLRVRSSSSGTMVLTHGRRANRERMAARRLVERGLLAGPNFMGTQRITNWKGVAVVHAEGGLYVYTLTEKGRTAWIRSKI